jgi:chemotaxis protein histidine kinase CheA
VTPRNFPAAAVWDKPRSDHGELKINFDGVSQNNDNIRTMNFKNVFPWLCVVSCVAAAAFFFNANQKQTAELTALRAQSQELEQLRADVEQLKTSGSESQQKEIARLRKDAADVLKLRAEVTQLRTTKQQLVQQVTTLQAKPQPTPEAQRLQAENQQLRAVVTQTSQQAKQNDYDVVSSCVNNLRQLAAAKHQWALENRKSETAIPTEREVGEYCLGGIPKCLGGGVYTIGALNVTPTCSLPNHLLP